MTGSLVPVIRLDRTLKSLAIAALLLLPSVMPAAALTLDRRLSDNMVIQRDKSALITGTAERGAEVTVSFAGQKETAKAGDDGAWRVRLKPIPARAAPQELTAACAGDTITMSNVLVGDVFLVARQTSIDISLGRDKEGQQAATTHKANSLLRVMRIQTLPSAKPLADLTEGATEGWAVVDKKTALGMSAAAYYLGRDLAASTGVPVGIIDLNMGTAFPISWLSREALEETESLYGRSDVPGQIKRFDNLVDLAAKGEPMPNKEVVTSNFVEHEMFPAGSYNAVLNPLKGLALKAAVVQVGNDYPYMIYAELEKNGTQFDRPELNRAYVQTYDIRKNGWRMEPVTTTRVPREWREALGDEELPFGLVLPPGSDLHTLGLHHREMRELHRLTAQDNPAVGVILPGSENVPYSAQPQDEALLARRCLSWVQGAAYNTPNVPATGPLFEQLDADFNEATIHFREGTAEGLSAGGGALDYFEAAGVEGDYSPVKARIDGNTIRIKSDTITRITRVRYNWNKRPNQELVNAAGLPAIPFRTEKAEYEWFVTNEDNDLPMEYHTPANEWKKSDVTLVNGQLKTHGYPNFTGWLGPVGVKTGPFGPNMGVREVKPGSPADGKLLVGDVIYSANGNMLGEKAWEVMGAAITESETREAGGKLVLGVRREGENVDVNVVLDIMGSYSPTAPYDCPKTEEIITDLENWVVAGGGGPGFLNTDAIFLLATGNPKLQGLVRRAVYSHMATVDPSAPFDPTKAGKSWHNSANAFLLGEYYLATGDRNVLPYLKNSCDRLAATQNKEEGGWRHNFPGGPTYGLIPNAGLPGVMGMCLAKQAGLDINTESYELGLKHFGRNRAETGYLIYGFGGCEREVPAPIDPEAMATGHLNTYNGGLSAAGILMGLAGKHRAAHLCSFISAHAWNNTFDGHGGNFWNNFWTPLGAHQHSPEAFTHFWRNYRWYRECNRMFDGSLIQHESGKVGAGPGVALVAPRRRIQIVGAPSSPFAADAPEYLEPALSAYWQRDYAGCEKLVNDVLAGGTVGKAELPTVEYLARAAREIQESTAADLDNLKSLIEQGKPYEASLDLAQLKGVVPDGDESLAAIEQALAAVHATAMKADEKRYKDVLTSRLSGADKQEEVAAEREWECLVTEIATPQSKGKGEFALGKVPEEEASVWRMKVVEAPSQAPENWTEPKFDDAEWGKTHLPISWRMYHTVLLRTKFNVKDRKAYDGLRLRGWFFRQQAMEIYLNGELIGKVNNLEKKTGDLGADFNESVMKKLKNGENTLAVTSRHNWRWGMLFMRVYNDGYGFRLDARLKE